MSIKNLTLGLLFVVAVGMVACNKPMNNEDEAQLTINETTIEKYLKDSSLTATRDSTGMYYYLRLANPTGEKAKVGDAATIKITGYLLNGTKVVSSDNDKNLPLVFPVGGYQLLGGIERGIFLMRTGEKATFLLPYYLAFGNYDRTSIPKYSPIKLEMEFVKTRTEVQQINEFLTDKQFVVSERSVDNLVIIRSNVVTGDTLGAGKSVSVKYVGKLLDGTKFDEGTFTFTTGTGGSIAGFDRAVRRMRKTEKAIVVFPSALGYKATGTTTILPYAPLNFELEIL